MTYQKVTLTLALAALAFLLSLVIGQCLADAHAGGARPPTAVAVSRLAPDLEAAEARAYAELIDRAAAPHDLDPILIAAIVARESSYRDDVARGRIRGSRGEVGLLQIMPRGAALRHAPPGCRQTEPDCSIATGAGYLAALRDKQCPGSTWRWVAAYGRRRCPTEAEARGDRATRRAWSLYRHAGGADWPAAPGGGAR